MVKFCGMRKGVRLVFQHETEGPVFVAGTFNNWSMSATPMQRVAHGRWEVTLDLPPGEHQFRYYANGCWFTDYAADGIERNALGQYNSVIVVPAMSDLPPAEKAVPSLRLLRPHARPVQLAAASAEQSADVRISAGS